MEGTAWLVKLILVLGFVQNVCCDGYAIGGLVAASTCALLLFVIVIFVAVFFTIWSEIVSKHFEKRGIRKSPRKLPILRPKMLPHQAVATGDAQVQLAAQQRMRPKLPNTWRDKPQHQRVPEDKENIVTSTSFQNEEFYLTGPVFSDGGGGGLMTTSTANPQIVTIVTELEDIPDADRGRKGFGPDVNGVQTEHWPSGLISAVNPGYHVDEPINNSNVNTEGIGYTEVAYATVQRPERGDISVEDEKVTQF